MQQKLLRKESALEQLTRKRPENTIEVQIRDFQNHPMTSQWGQCCKRTTPLNEQNVQHAGGSAATKEQLTSVLPSVQKVHNGHLEMDKIQQFTFKIAQNLITLHMKF